MDAEDEAATTVILIQNPVSLVSAGYFYRRDIMAQCIYNTWQDGCSMAEDAEEVNFKTDAVGWDKEGYCVVEEDECPSDSCFYYEDQNEEEEEE